MASSIGVPNTAWWYRSFSLRYLAHMITDIHQPLHALSRCLEGGASDLGGNLGNKFLVQGFDPDPPDFDTLTLAADADPQLWSLHQLWDGKAHHDPSLDVLAYANAFMQEYPVESNFTTGFYNNITVDVVGTIADIQAINFSASKSEVESALEAVFKVVLEESKQLGTEINKFAYPSDNSTPPWPTPNEVVPDEYLDYMVGVMEKRIAAGGYRLAAVLDKSMATDNFDDAPISCGADGTSTSGATRVSTFSVISMLLLLCMAT